MVRNPFRRGEGRDVSEARLAMVGLLTVIALLVVLAITFTRSDRTTFRGSSGGSAPVTTGANPENQPASR